MRFNLIDIFFAIASGFIGVAIEWSLSPQLPSWSSPQAKAGRSREGSADALR